MTDRSKWDILTERHQKAYQEYLRLDREIKWLEKTTFDGACTGCGAPLPTEADFARHFLLRDPRFLNIGYCPITDKEDRTRHE